MRTSVAAAAFCAACTAAIAITLMGADGLSPIDNHRFIETTFRGKSFGMYVMPEVGRFFPLTAQEFVWAARIFGWSVDLWYLMAAAKIVMSAALLFWAIRSAAVGSLSTVVLWSAVVFSPGFANASYRLQVAEINLLILSLLFVCLILWTERSATIKPGVAAGARVAAVVALAIGCFYKEVGFILPLVFGVLEIVRRRRSEQPRVPAHVWACIAVGAAYVAGFMTWRAHVVTGSYASFHSLSWWQAIPLFAASDPFLIFVAVPLALYRLARIARHRREHSIFDSFLFASVAFVCAYVALGMHNHYYLLPAYGFAACGVAGFLAEAGRLWRAAIVAVCAAGVVHSAPIAISDMQMERAISKSYQPFVSSLVQWLWENPPAEGRPRRIVLAGVTPGFGYEIIYSLKKFMEGAGADPASFDVVPSEDTDRPVITSFYGISPAGHRTTAGDVLVFNPYQNAPKTLPAGASFEEIGIGRETWTIPRLGGFSWIRTCVPRPQECGTMIKAGRQPAGYVAFLKRREPVPPTSYDVRSSAYRVAPFPLPARLPRASETVLKVVVQNAGVNAWPADGSLGPLKLVNMAYVWLNANGGVSVEGQRSAFPEPIFPGEAATVYVTVKAPQAPGDYRLVLSPVQEGVKWFYLEPGGIGVQGATKLVEVY